MKKLLLLSLFSSAAFAMDVAPEPVAMSDEQAPSHFSKQAHQNCCGLCCAATVFAVLECVAWNNSKLHWSYCAVPGNKCTRGSQGLIGLSEGILAAQGLQIGRYLGAKTFELDQRLNARLKKEKSE